MTDERLTSQRTATAVLDAAEVAFATHGIDRASLRAIMREAGTNPAAVHYHYGGREQLAGAVLDRILEPLQRRRLELLEAAVASADSAPTLDALVDALLRPDFEALLSAQARDPRAARIVGAIYSRPADYVQQLVEASFGPVAAAFSPHLSAVLPELGPAELSWRVRWNIFGMLGALLSSEEAELITRQTLDRATARAVAAAVGALSAPPTEETQP